jgi:hypothetical protein
MTVQTKKSAYQAEAKKRLIRIGTAQRFHSKTGEVGP